MTCGGNHIVCGELSNPQGPGLSPAWGLSCVDLAFYDVAQKVVWAAPTDPHNLDRDDDGVACEELIGRCSNPFSMCGTWLERDGVTNGRRRAAAEQAAALQEADARATSDELARRARLLQISETDAEACWDVVQEAGDVEALFDTAWRFDERVARLVKRGPWATVGTAWCCVHIEYYVDKPER